MAKATNKTTANNLSPSDYINAIEQPQKREDAQWLLEFCERMTGEKAKMWGPSIVGCGSYHYVYHSGREGDLFLAGFAARKSALVAYLVGQIDEQDDLKQTGQTQNG